MTAVDARTGRGELSQVTHQLVRDALGALTERMRVALRGVSGNPAAAGDGHCTALHLPDGSLVAAASPGGRLTRAAPASLLVEHLRERGDAEPGDVFVANDPYVGSLSQLDLYVAAPVHHGEELVAWVSAMLRQTDLGGVEFGGLTPRARDAFHEGVRLPGLKLADARGRRRDAVELLLASTRKPEAVEADLHALQAAAGVGTARLGELLARHGAEVVTGVMDRMLASSADQLRARLLELPDGVVRAADFLEHDGGDNWLATVDLVLNKQGDRLLLDFAGSSAQVSGFVNTTRAGLLGGVAGALAPTLGFGIPWNHGLLRPVELHAPDGLICTARPPAPVGAGATGTVWVVANVVATAVNKLLACSPAYLARARAGSSGAMGVVALGGLDDGERFSVQLGDPIAGGGGAWAAADGLDAAGPVHGPSSFGPASSAPRTPEWPLGSGAGPGLADVETTEQALPVEYLYRRLATGSGGAGRSRGGRGGEAAFTLAGLDAADALILTHGQEVPNAGGLFGGWPGATVRQRFGHAVLRDNPAEPGALPGRPEAADGGWEELGPKPGRMPMTDTDVVAVSWQGGGGWGDPLERDPEAVWADVRAGAVTRDIARRVYGVLGDGDHADPEATADLRKGMRTERVGQTVGGQEPHREIDGVWPLGGSLRLVRAGGAWQVRSSHGALLATGTTGWRAGAIPRPLLPDRRTEGVLLHHDLAMTAFFCPLSGELLAVDVHRLGTEPIDDIVLDLESVKRLFDREEERRDAGIWDEPSDAGAQGTGPGAGYAAGRFPALAPGGPHPGSAYDDPGLAEHHRDPATRPPGAPEAAGAQGAPAESDPEVESAAASGIADAATGSANVEAEPDAAGPPAPPGSADIPTGSLAPGEPAGSPVADAGPDDAPAEFPVGASEQVDGAEARTEPAGAHEWSDEADRGAGPIGAHERIEGAEGEPLPVGAHERDPVEGAGTDTVADTVAESDPEAGEAGDGAVGTAEAPAEAEAPTDESATAGAAVAVEPETDAEAPAGTAAVDSGAPEPDAAAAVDSEAPTNEVEIDPEAPTTDEVTGPEAPAGTAAVDSEPPETDAAAAVDSEAPTTDAAVGPEPPAGDAETEPDARATDEVVEPEALETPDPDQAEDAALAPEAEAEAGPAVDAPEAAVAEAPEGAAAEIPEDSTPEAADGGAGPEAAVHDPEAGAGPDLVDGAAPEAPGGSPPGAPESSAPDADASAAEDQAAEDRDDSDDDRGEAGDARSDAGSVAQAEGEPAEAPAAEAGHDGSDGPEEEAGDSPREDGEPPKP